MILFSVLYIGLLVFYGWKIFKIKSRFRVKRDLYYTAGLFIFMRFCMIGFLSYGPIVLTQVIYAIILIFISIIMLFF